MMIPTDLTGIRNGELTVIERVKSTRFGMARWRCQCLYCDSFTLRRSAELRARKNLKCTSKLCKAARKYREPGLYMFVGKYKPQETC